MNHSIQAQDADVRDAHDMARLASGHDPSLNELMDRHAAKLFQSFSFSREAQQLIIEVGGLRSVHSQTEEKPGRRPFKDIKTMKDDAAAVEKEGDAIKARYTKIFRV